MPLPDKDKTKAFQDGFRKATNYGAEDSNDSANSPEESGSGAYQTAKEMLGMVGEGANDMAQSAADYLGLKRKK